MPFDRTGTSPFQVDPDRIGYVKPTLGEVEGYALRNEDLHRVFGINPEYFGKLPKHLIVPILEGRWYTENWYHVTGYLYEIEPKEWVPVVSHGDTMAASTFKSTYIREEEKVTETKFNAGTSAEISIEAGGSYYGVTASVKSTSELSFRYSQSTTTKETLTTKGVSGNEPVHQLFLYPTLKGKAVRRQRIDYTLNDSSAELKWTPRSYDKGYWDERWVDDGRLGEVRKLAFHPVPMEGNGLPNKGYILPLPWFSASGLEYTTIMSRSSWRDWYVYDIPWESCDKTISIAAPKNDVAFRPMSTWTTLPPLSDAA
ncbi:hypothetical protein BBP40_006606 [Aspergillus hancockii]|nr:hypothetical protein BBP40_006606 [Aspergillus hancockii]